MDADREDKRNAARRGGRHKSPLRALIGDRSGATAIEFAALVLPFALLIFAILESCVSFAAQQVLANETDAVARQIRTGQLQPGSISAQSLHNLVCPSIQLLVASGCPGLVFDLEQYTTFAQAAAVRIPYKADGELDNSNFKVAPGGSGTKNMLRVFYEWPAMTSFMSAWMTTGSSGYTLLFATDTWQNEPY